MIKKTSQYRKKQYWLIRFSFLLKYIDLSTINEIKSSISVQNLHNISLVKEYLSKIVNLFFCKEINFSCLFYLEKKKS